MPEKKPHNYSIEVLRLIAILAVIFIHTSTRTLETISFAIQDYQWTVFLNQIFRFAVPLFFLISGFVLELNYPAHTNYLTYLKKRLSRIVIPYIFWSAIYYLFIYTHHADSFLKALLTGSASYQLYFIPSLLIFYLIFPIIHKCFKFLTNRFIIIALGILQLSLLTIDYYFQRLPFFYPLTIVILNYYVFLLGVLASHHETTILRKVKKYFIVVLTSTILLAVLVFMEGNYLYLKTHNYIMLYSQGRPSILAYTTCLALISYSVLQKKKDLVDKIAKFSRLSFFVFFIHVIFLEAVSDKIKILIPHDLYISFIKQGWYDPAFFFIVASLSFGTAYLVHKIPYSMKLTG